jgi:hypothetical protein
MRRKRNAVALITILIVVIFVLGARLGVSKNSGADAQLSVREQLVGSWSLQSRETTLSDGKVVVDPGLSATPSGVLIYDRSGHVAAQLSRRGRTVEMIANECHEAAQIRGTTDTAQTVLGYDAYFGTYTVDEEKGIVTHHLESALFPGDIGKNIKRAFTISANRLTIRFSTTTNEGIPVTRTLVWTRMK